jgi:hypothetical protein
LVEAQIREEREAMNLGDMSFRSMSSFISGRDYVIRYADNEQDIINVSDDEDLLTAYDIAESELKGSLKFTISFKARQQESSILNLEPFDSMASIISKNAMKKAMKEAEKETKKKEKKSKIATLVKGAKKKVKE